MLSQKRHFKSAYQLCARRCLASNPQVWFHPKQIGKTATIATVVNAYGTLWLPGTILNTLGISSHFRNEQRITITISPTL